MDRPLSWLPLHGSANRAVAGRLATDLRRAIVGGAHAVSILVLAVACFAPRYALASGALPDATSRASGADYDLSRHLHRHQRHCDGGIGAEPFNRTELYFGLSRPGGVVGEDQFQEFVDGSITPRFPEGLTLLSGVGQFRDASGRTVVEGSKVLILLYPRRDATASQKIESIRGEYRAQFQQESVLRTDDVSCVSF